MSWNKTTVEGQTMYERSDGVRVSRTQDIEAIERQECVRSDKFMGDYINYQDDTREYSGNDEVNPIGLALVIIMIVSLIVTYLNN